MITPYSSKSAFLKTDQGNDFKNAVFVFVKKIDSYSLPGILKVLDFINLFNYWILAGVEVGRGFRLPSKYLPWRERRLLQNSKVPRSTYSFISEFYNNFFRPTLQRILHQSGPTICAVADALRPTHSLKFNIKTVKQRSFFGRNL